MDEVLPTPSHENKTPVPGRGPYPLDILAPLKASRRLDLAPSPDPEGDKPGRKGDNLFPFAFPLWRRKNLLTRNESVRNDHHAFIAAATR